MIETRAFCIMDAVASPEPDPLPALTPHERRARLSRAVEEDYRFIWRLLRRFGVPAEAIADATQQVFLILAERLDEVKERSERSFAFGTALRLARTMRRTRGRETSSDLTDERASLLPLPDELSDQRRARRILDDILDDMPMDLRTVFVLFELEGLTSPEIAELMDIPLGTAASRLRRAREAFRERIASRRSAGTQRGGTE